MSDSYSGNVSADTGDRMPLREENTGTTEREDEVFNLCSMLKATFHTADKRLEFLSVSFLCSLVRYVTVKQNYFLGRFGE